MTHCPRAAALAEAGLTATPLSAQPQGSIVMDLQAVVSLHRYFIAADLARREFQVCVQRSIGASTQIGAIDPVTLVTMGLWYGSLFVVVEGWQELGLTDGRIDALIASPNTDLLRRYRNGVFHFQKHYWDDRFTRFVMEQGAAVWVNELHREFDRWFIETIGAKRHAWSSLTSK